MVDDIKINKEIAVIIGGLKCGTTSLFSYLSEHPQIAASVEKELHHFSHPKNYSLGIDYYYSKWNIQPQHRIALEASPTYTMLPYRRSVAERIRRVENANFRFIYIMRHPISRIESHIRHKAHAMGLNSSEIESIKFDPANIEFSKYTYQIDEYVKNFGRDKIHLLTLEDLTKNPLDELQKICLFLEVDPKYEFKDYESVFNSKQSFKLPPAIYKIRHSRLASFIDTFPTGLRHFVRNLISDQKKIDFRLSEEDKKFFAEALKPDLIQLQQKYHIDVKAQWSLLLD